MDDSSFHSLRIEPRAHWAGQRLDAATPGRGIWRTLDHLSGRGSSCAACNPQDCWGSTILRISYEDDTRFAQAVSTIHRLAVIWVDHDQEFPPDTVLSDPSTQPTREEMDDYDATVDRDMEANWIRVADDARARIGTPEATPLSADTVANYEFKRHFHCITIEDKAALNGATTDAAQLYYRHRDQDLYPHESGPRSSFFMYLDKETIEHLAGAPTDEELAQMGLEERCQVAWRHWVKIVETWDPDYESEVPPDALRIASMRKRVRLVNLLPLYIDMTDSPLEEMGIERENTDWPGGQDVMDWWCTVEVRLEGAAAYASKWLEEYYGNE